MASSTLSPYSDSSANSKTAKACSSSSDSDSDNSDSPPPTVPTSLSTSSSYLPIPNMDVTLLAQERRHVTKYSTPTKKPRMNLLMANDIKRMMTVHARSSLQILDSGAGISGVGEQWKVINILSPRSIWRSNDTCPLCKDSSDLISYQLSSYQE